MVHVVQGHLSLACLAHMPLPSPFQKHATSTVTLGPAIPLPCTCAAWASSGPNLLAWRKGSTSSDLSNVVGNVTSHSRTLEVTTLFLVIFSFSFDGGLSSVPYPQNNVWERCCIFFVESSMQLSKGYARMAGVHKPVPSPLYSAIHDASSCPHPVRNPGSTVAH